VARKDISLLIEGQTERTRYRTASRFISLIAAEEQHVEFYQLCMPYHRLHYLKLRSFSESKKAQIVVEALVLLEAGYWVEPLSR
jgi:hypothetical protein